MIGILCEVRIIINFTDDQQKIVDYILEQVQLGDEGKNVIISGQGGTGKAQPDDTQIPTPTGIKRLDELKVGDYVFDVYGKPTKITHIFPQGKLKNYKLSFSDGRTAYCNDEHLWCVVHSNKSKKHFRNSKSLKEMMVDYKKKDSRGYNVFKYKIPTASVIFPKQMLPVDPYVVGCFLGDGCCLESALTISSNDEELVREVADKLCAKYYKLHEHNYSWIFKENNKNILTKQIFKDIPQLINYSYNKIIPAEYLYSSEEQRFELLAGLFDTDGAARKNRAQICYTSTSRKMIEQVRWLILSLGCHCGQILADSRNDKYIKGCWSINISGPKEKLLKMFHLKRKKEIVLQQKEPRSRYDITTLQNIEYVGECSMRCIMVDNPEHLYVTEDFIVTHNTEMICEVICLLLSMEKSVAVGAMTGKATAVIRGKVENKLKENHIIYNKKDLLIETVSKITKESKVLGITKDGETVYSNKWRKPENFNFDVLILDELSMVPYYVSLWWQRTRSLVIGLGDFCQLPEVLGADTNKEIQRFCYDLGIDFESFKQ